MLHTRIFSVPLPSQVGGGDVEVALMNNYKVRSLCMLIGGELYLRICAHAYATAADFRRLRDAIIEMRNEPKQPQVDKGYVLPIMHWDLSVWVD